MLDVLDGFKLDKINNSNFPLRTFRCTEASKILFKAKLRECGWKIISEGNSTIHDDIIIKAAKKNFVFGMTPAERERHGITTARQTTFE